MGRFVGRPEWLTRELIDYNRWLEEQVVLHFELDQCKAEDLLQSEMTFPLDYEEAGLGAWFDSRFIGLLCYYTVHLDDRKATDAEGGRSMDTLLQVLADPHEFDLTHVVSRQQMSCLRSVLDYCAFVENGKLLLGFPGSDWLRVPPLIRNCESASGRPVYGLSGLS